MKKWIVTLLFGLLGASAMAEGFSISLNLLRTTYATFRAELSGLYVYSAFEGLDLGLPITASTDPIYQLNRFNLEISPFVRYTPEIFRVEGFSVNALIRVDAPFKVVKSLDPNPNDANPDERVVRFGFYDFSAVGLVGLESTLKLGEGLYLSNSLKYSLPVFPTFYKDWYATAGMGISYIFDTGSVYFDAVALVSDSPFNGKFTAGIYYPFTDNLNIVGEAVYNIRDGFSISVNTTLKF